MAQIKCPVCEKLFRTLGGLEWHLQNIHGQMKPQPTSGDSVSREGHASLQTPANTGSNGPPADGFRETVAKWQRQLLQLDRRNNLLYFRPGKTAVRIVDHTPDSMMQVLTSSRHGLTFDYAEPRSRGRAVSPQTGMEEGDDSDSKPYVVPGDLRGDCPPLDLQRRLGNLRRRARQWQEEQGLNVLFLALGSLRWVDEEGEPAIAPLLLLPCRLERASPRDAFTLWQEEEDLTTNSTLAVKLNEEFGIGLPDVDSEVETAGKYLDAVRGLVRKRPEWEVADDVYLATFAYSKLAMWRDLEIIKNPRTGHSTVLALAGAAPSEQPGSSTPSALVSSLPSDLAGARLDDVLQVRDQFAVLPADYSQLLAITTARQGSNLVIHGPPGTGKSQTIANIIATLLAEGKSVLFVSEKTAALDVVKRRLDEKQLGVFCLDLHSERGSKESVYQQLQKSVDDQRVVRKLDFDYAALAAYRTQLNRVVRALHQVRQPLGRTIFQVQGRFASVRDLPHVPFGVGNLEKLDQECLVRILQASDGIRLRRKEFKEHWTSHWRVLKAGSPSLDLANRIRMDMRVLSAAAAQVKSVVPRLGEVLGLPPPNTLDEIARLEKVARHMASAPGVPRIWLNEGVTKRLRSVAEREADLQRTRAGLIEHLSSVFGTPTPKWDFAALAEELFVTTAEERSLRTLLGEHWQHNIVQGQQADSLRQVGAALGRGSSLGEEVSTFLEHNSPENWVDVLRLQELVRTVARLGPVPAKWIEPQEAQAVIAILGKAREAAKELCEAEKQLFSEYEPGVLDVVDRDMLVRYRTDHQSRLRRLLSSSYRTDRKALQGFRHRPGGLSFQQQLGAVQKIVDVQRKSAAWDEVSAELAPVLLSRYVGRETDWDSLVADVRDVQALLEGSAGNRSRLAELLTSASDVSRARELAQKLGETTTHIEHLMETALADTWAQNVRERAVTLLSLKQVIQDATPTVVRIENVAGVARMASPGPIRDLCTLHELLTAGARLLALEREHSGVEDALLADFGARFKGFDTDWSDIMACLAWAEELLKIVSAGGPSAELAAQAQQPRELSAYASIAESAAHVLEELRTQTEPLRANYDLEVGPWGSWGRATFDDVEKWAGGLSQDADCASDWLLYTMAVAQLDGCLEPGTVEGIRRQTDESELVPQIVERRLLGAWLDWAYQQEPSLSKFTSSGQENLISQFKELDGQLAVAAQNEVRRRVFQRYPNIYSTSAKNSELGILLGQLSKKRRWPVRKLFGTVPHLIQTLKPCCLVSPLAVSQYLPLSALATETANFDVVIFDEASQVFPEDAVPAVLRGKQTILAGDQKQLPPTSFWRESLAEDEDELDDDADDATQNQLEGRESILDVAVGQVGQLFNQAHLNVHYRSKDESLIRFSNIHFYTPPGLLTFPSPGLRDLWNGVHDVFVPDGRYDAGKGATHANRKEAEKVVELVFEHMRTRPGEESLGVVALSRPQADLIERLVDERRILERDVDQRFNERPDEPFFVKNLENVQGDERDHMIISIGYGPTLGSGAVPNRFGPVNKTGGERRLNVVITRARQRVDIVHSLRASDIHSQQEGARLLRRYLEYAANPQQAFEGEVTVDTASEPESPFEASVEQALAAKGYRVARQVGVAGYRIDLAILSEDGTKYDLGIECDGWRYHNVPAARDRDWLRQKVLEGLGWKIHRVWSTAWVRNPQAELARIETALANARARITYDVEGTLVTGVRGDTSEDAGTMPDPPGVEIVATSQTEVRLAPYEQAPLSSLPQWADLRYETTQNLVCVVIRIAEIEGPVHKEVVMQRIQICYRLQRMREDARANVEAAIQSAERGGSIRSDGTFVWLKDEQLGRQPRRPVDHDIEHVPPTELRATVLGTAKAMFGSPRADLVVEAARTLGFSRTGDRIAEVLEGIVQGLLDKGQLVESFGMVRASGQ